MEPDAIATLLPLALGHDQEASSCPWFALTRQTADYPSRKAQAAIAVANGLVPPATDVVDLLYRCDHCGRCRAVSTLSNPPDLARALWSVRAWLVENGAVPEVSSLGERFRASGSIYGDLSAIGAILGSGDDDADVLFVPGASTLSCAPEEAAATLDLLRSLGVRVDIQIDTLDSGQELRELGLASQAEDVQSGVRRRVAEGAYRFVIAGTPKEAFGLKEALADHLVEVKYAGEYLADRFERLPRPHMTGANAVFFQPSEVLLHRLNGFDVIDHWLTSWLGGRYQREADPRRNAWPAAIERPSPRVPEEMKRRLAEQRFDQILSASRIDGGPLTVLTSDPLSQRALREVAPPNVDVVDLVVFASQMLKKETAVGR